jgi:hypothetical protein
MRWVAVGAAAVPTVVVLATVPHGRHSYVFFDDTPMDVTTIRLINAWFAWQTVVGLAVPAILAAAGLLPRRARRPATLVGAVALTGCALLAGVMAAIRGSVHLPALFPAAPTVVAWLCLPCFAASAAALWLGHREPT